MRNLFLYVFNTVQNVDAGGERVVVLRLADVCTHDAVDVVGLDQMSGCRNADDLRRRVGEIGLLCHSGSGVERCCLAHIGRRSRKFEGDVSRLYLRECR